jgi:hypothetical protein
MNRISLRSAACHRRRFFRPILEQLEDRSLLSAFASIEGNIAEPGARDVVPIHIDTAYFSLHRWGSYLGFEVHAASGSQLDPSPVQIQQQDKSVTATVWKSLDGTQRSVSLATVRSGNFQLVVSGDKGTAGRYEVDVFLVGDANGDYQVDQRDVKLIHNLRGKRLGQAGYVPDADANRDGVINSVDEGLARTNLRTTTYVRPLTVTLGVDPALDPLGNGVVQIPNITLVGHSAPRAKLQLDQNSDGAFDQQTTADLSGRFQFDTVVPAGPTPFYVEATDQFGQRTAADLSLTASFSRSVLPGAAQSIPWHITGDATNQDIVIQAQAPGDVYDPHGSFAVTPGNLPATGQVFFLKPDNTWTNQDTVFVTGQTSGNVSVGLPSATEGEWRLSVLIRDHASGQIASVQSQTLLVSSKPAIDLRLNRTLANSGDVIHAELLTSAGQTPRDVRLFASLSLPDGSEISLPGLATSMESLYEGPSRDGQFVLLSQPLSFLGVGEYHLRARLLDGTTSDLLAMADAELTISDTPGTLSGVVRDAGGQPVDGSQAQLARIEAFDGDDGYVTASAPVGSDGTYQLSLDPGRYNISAIVLDAQGNLHAAHSTAVTVIGPEGPHVQLDLALDGSSQTTAIQAVTSSLVAAEGEAAGALEKRKVFIQETFQGVPAELKAPLHDIALNEIQSRALNANISSTTELEATLANATRASQSSNSSLSDQEYFNNPDVQRAAVLAEPGDNVVLSEITRDSGQRKQTVRFTLRDKDGHDILPVIQHTTTDLSDAALEAIVRQASAELAPRIPTDARADRVLPVVPTLKVTLDQNVALQLGFFLHFTVTLTDQDGSIVGAADLPVRVVVQPPPFHGVSLDPQVIRGRTDADGHFTAPFPAGDNTGVGTVQAFFTRTDGTYESLKVPFRVATAAAFGLSSPRLTVHAGETVPVDVILLSAEGSGGMPVANADVDLVATGGAVLESHFKTDATGRHRVMFTAGDSTGDAQIVADTAVPSTQTGNTDRLTAMLQFYVTGNVDLTIHVRATGASNQLRTAQHLAISALDSNSTPEVIDGTSASLFADVFVGDTVVASQPVEFTITGAGSMSATENQTDDSGLANDFYVPPATGSGTATITATTTVDGKDYTKSIDITYQPATLSVSPTSVTLAPGSTQQFTSSLSPVNWTATGGTISADGLFTAGTSSGTFQVTATSVSDPTNSAQASVSISSDVSVTVSPSHVTVARGTTRQFTATVSGTTNTGVTWSATRGGGTITSAGLYTPPRIAGTYSVIATSVADKTKWASAEVVVGSIFDGTYQGTMTIFTDDPDYQIPAPQQVTWVIRPQEASENILIYFSPGSGPTTLSPSYISDHTISFGKGSSSYAPDLTTFTATLADNTLTGTWILRVGPGIGPNSPNGEVRTTYAQFTLTRPYLGFFQTIP